MSNEDENKNEDEVEADTRSVIEIAEAAMKKFNFIDKVKSSYGIAVLTNGTIVKILYNFEIVAENWRMYNKAISLDDQNLIKEILTVNTDGGIVDTGDVMIDINLISTMHPLYRNAALSEKDFMEYTKREMIIESYFYNSDGEIEE